MNNQRQALAAVDALGNLLRKEIAAIEGGQFSQLVEYSGEKARLSAVLEKQLQENPEAVSKEQLSGLKELILRDQQHLQQAQRATAEVIQEVTDTRERHSLAGLYGREGAKRVNRATPSPSVDKSF
ncbi:hypothetical protein SAMN04488040_3100 [Sulfitobacter marinus]|uniref:FlgN protein n=1 Tax=Sulfitobacter marinus TaxID=394264 RepID=A0A1I6V554_9RHOB|nr:hypothetical protein [Sulfitobacter marinus]SFT08868.1 hypothetical protein SAMN04488040_3100 [Sulfitobacter marinus]